MTVRVALGTAIHLGLRRGKSPQPTTAHLLTPGKCTFDCAYCTKARTAKSKPDFMCRVTWPAFPEQQVWEALEEHSVSFKRICIQVVNRQGTSARAKKWIREISDRCEAPISVERRARSESEVEEFLRAGAECVGLPLDVASENLYPKLRGGSMDEAVELILKSANRFPQRISTHIIVGLGETDREIVEVARRMQEKDVSVGLFAFTPCQGTKLENRRPPSLERFRRIQLATYLAAMDESLDIEYDFEGRVVLPEFDECQLLGMVANALLTRGCQGCNRPLYNERPGCSPYNYPEEPTGVEMEEAMQVIRG